MGFRIYVDESGTHADDWLVIGMLFVPDHGTLHAALCKTKDDLEYFNRSPKRKARYKETHLTEFKSDRDVAVTRKWCEAFVQSSAYFRCVVIDWRIWDGSFFGGPFEADALKKRRAYKKWAEMLLHPELKEPLGGQSIRGAELYLDKLRILHGYDVIPELEERFTRRYEGESPFIAKFQHTNSWRDANQCLQLCDVLTGSMYQTLHPAKNEYKRAARACVEEHLKPLGVERLESSFWKGYESSSLRKNFPKFSAWFWRPDRGAIKAKRRARRKRGHSW